MNVDEVPQEGNRTLGRHRKAMYARAADGRMILVPSRGSEVDETVTVQAVERMRGLAAAARARAAAGVSSPLEAWMYARRMDLALLSQVSGVWQWRIRRHFDPLRFGRLGNAMRARYAAALGVAVADLASLPADDAAPGSER